MGTERTGLTLPILDPMVLFLSVVVQVKKKRRNYPKCVPLAKARAMSPSQRRAAVSRKKKAERKSRKGKKPNYAKT